MPKTLRRHLCRSHYAAPLLLFTPIFIFAIFFAMLLYTLQPLAACFCHYCRRWLLLILFSLPLYFRHADIFLRHAMPSLLRIIIFVFHYFLGFRRPCLIRALFSSIITPFFIFFLDRYCCMLIVIGFHLRFAFLYCAPISFHADIHTEDYAMIWLAIYAIFHAIAVASFLFRHIRKEETLLIYMPALQERRHITLLPPSAILRHRHYYCHIL